MSLILKILVWIGVLIGILFLLIFGIGLYLDRPQNKEFYSYLGSSISVCDKSYDSQSEEFLKVKEWLQNHQTEWREYRITVPAGLYIRGENVSFIFSDYGVIAAADNSSYSRSTDEKMQHFIADLGEHCDY